jgi:hypothetical protein
MTLKEHFQDTVNSMLTAETMNTGQCDLHHKARAFFQSSLDIGERHTENGLTWVIVREEHLVRGHGRVEELDVQERDAFVFVAPNECVLYLATSSEGDVKEMARRSCNLFESAERISMHAASSVLLFNNFES